MTKGEKRRAYTVLMHGTQRGAPRVRHGRSNVAQAVPRDTEDCGFTETKEQAGVTKET